MREAISVSKVGEEADSLALEMGRNGETQVHEGTVFLISCLRMISPDVCSARDQAKCGEHSLGIARCFCKSRGNDTERIDEQIACNVRAALAGRLTGIL